MNKRGIKTKELWENPEYRKRMSEAHIGIKMPPFTQEHKERIRKTMLGQKYTAERCVNISNAQIGRVCLWQRGEKSRFWKGGRTALRLAIKNLIQYKKWRRDVFSRDNFTCQMCWKKGGKIQADHKKAFHLILTENNIKIIEDAVKCDKLWDLNNGRTLCRHCHFKTPNYGRAKENFNSHSLIQPIPIP